MLSALFSVFASAGDDLSLTRVVIDAGHGGSDPGCVSTDRKTFEKTLTLEISKLLAEKIRTEFPDVKVALTRSNDSFVSLDSRAQTANRMDAQLFISIHVNSCPSSSPNGYSIHVLGQSSNKNRDLYAYNLNVCQRENSVVKLEDDYTTRYQDFDPSDPESFIFMTLMQNAYLEQSLSFAQTVADKLSGGPLRNGRGIWQDPFYVLWKTSMPAVLVELGFMSNSADLAVLRNHDNLVAIANRLSDAFKAYKSGYDRSVSIDTPEPEASVLYGVQIFTLSRRLPENDPLLLGYPARVIVSGSRFKYVIAVSDDLGKTRSALADIRRKYPDCFLVSIEGSSAVAVK